MSVINDLRWQEVNEAFQSLGNKLNVGVDGYGNPIFSHSSETPVGVVEFLNRLLEGCRAAQERINQGRPANEKLTSFPAVVAGAPIGGFIVVSRSVVCKYELESVTKITGTNA